MLVFKSLLNKVKEKYGDSAKFALMFTPMVCLYIFGLRPAMNKSAFFGHFTWIADCLVFGPPIGLFIAHRVGYGVGTILGDNIFYPKSYLKVPPDIMSPIKGRIARKEYDEATEELNELLEEKPFSPEPYLLLVDISVESNDYQHAMELIEKYFSQEKIHAFDENIEMILLYADICQEHNYLDKAKGLLEQEIQRKGYSELKRKGLQTRLEAIEESFKG